MRNWRKWAGAGLVVGFTGFLLMLLLVKSGVGETFDDTVRYAFYDLRCDWLTAVARGITYLGNWQSIVALCLILLAVPHTRRSFGVPVSIGAALVTIINKNIKMLVARPRPDDILHLVTEGGFSFPSGHSITSMFVYGGLILLVRINVQDKRLADFLTVLLGIPAVLIGLSRIYLGVHYPTDVIAGWCLGIAGISIMAAIIKWRRSRKKI